MGIFQNAAQEPVQNPVTEPAGGASLGGITGKGPLLSDNRAAIVIPGQVPPTEEDYSRNFISSERLTELWQTVGRVLAQAHPMNLFYSVQRVGRELEVCCGDTAGPATIFKRGTSFENGSFGERVTITNDLPKSVVEIGSNAVKNPFDSFNLIGVFYRLGLQKAHELAQTLGKGARAWACELQPWMPGDGFGPERRVEEKRYKAFVEALSRLTSLIAPSELTASGRFGTISSSRTLRFQPNALVVSETRERETKTIAELRTGTQDESLPLSLMYAMNALQTHYQPKLPPFQPQKAMEAFAEAANSSVLAVLAQLALFGGGSVMNGPLGFNSRNILYRAFEGEKRARLGLRRWSEGDPCTIERELLEDMGPENAIFLDPLDAKKHGSSAVEMTDEKQVESIMGTTHPFIRVKYAENLFFQRVPRLELRVGGTWLPEDNRLSEVFLISTLRGLPKLIAQSGQDPDLLKKPETLEALLCFEKVEKAMWNIMVYGMQAEMDGFQELMRLVTGGEHTRIPLAADVLRAVFLPAAELGIDYLSFEADQKERIFAGLRERLEAPLPRGVLTVYEDADFIPTTSLVHEIIEGAKGVTNGDIQLEVLASLRRFLPQEESCYLLSMWLQRNSLEVLEGEGEATTFQKYQQFLADTQTDAQLRLWIADLLDWTEERAQEEARVRNEETLGAAPSIVARVRKCFEER